MGLPSFGRKLKERFESKRVAGGIRYAGFQPTRLRSPNESDRARRAVIEGKASVPITMAMAKASAAIDAKAKAAVDAKAKATM